MSGSEVFANPGEETTPGTEPRRAYANASAVTDFIDVVGGVDEVGSDFESAQGSGFEPVRKREVHLDGSWHVIAVGDVLRTGGAQAAAVDEIAADPRPAPEMAEARRSGVSLVALGVGYKTLANNCVQIKAKLGVSRTADLVRLAIETGVS